MKKSILFIIFNSFIVFIPILLIVLCSGNSWAPVTGEYLGYISIKEYAPISTFLSLFFGLISFSLNSIFILFNNINNQNISVKKINMLFWIALGFSIITFITYIYTFFDFAFTDMF